MQHKSYYNLSCRICAGVLIVLHFLTFGPIREALAFSASSASYRLNSGTHNQGGKERGVSFSKLLLHFDGQDNSRDFKDEAGNSITYRGNAKLDTAQKKFGTASGLFDGSGDYLSLADSEDWNFGSGNFTVDCWVKFNDITAAEKAIWGQFVDSNTYMSLHCAGTIVYFSIINSGSVASVESAANSITATNSWYHLAIVRNGNSWNLYVNGVPGTAVTDSDSVPDYAGSVYIGQRGDNNQYMNGWIEELRVSKGIARWSSNFTLPTIPYTLNFNEGTGSLQLTQDALGEPVQGSSQSASYRLNCGLIPTIQSNPPLQTQIIPNLNWKENEARPDAFDLDDYFTSDNGALSYTVSGNSNITVSIDSTTHKVSFSQGPAWYGTEKIHFTATDSESNSLISNEITLQVEGVDNPPVLDYIADVTVNENELVTITPNATDLDGDTITYSFTTPIDSQGRWQTDYTSSGTYTITVTATDSTSLTDTQTVLINVRNVNRPPVLGPISDITANEGDLVTVTPVASDPDNDALTFYYTSPLDSSGKWLTDYDDAGSYTVTVTVSDGIDTVSRSLSVIVNNTNRAPEATLTLDKYTVNPNEEFNITLSASDPDGDSMTFSLKKDGVEIAQGALSTTYTMSASFSSPGDHTISAIVTDSGGRSVNTSKGVDVVDPNSNRDSINPVMGDFNGDALSDLGLHNSENGKWEICLSDAGVFRNAVDWLTGFGTSRDWWPMGGDFNGDAKTDIAIYNNTTGEFKVALSGGSSFTASGTWLTVTNPSYSLQATTGNFNGDKYTDFALYNKDTGEVKVALGNGTGFGAFSSWLTGFGTDYIALSGDFNADSLTDICLFKKSIGEFKAAFSNTQGFVDGATWLTGFAADKDVFVSDFNNDGLADIGYWEKDSFKWYYAISTGAAFVNKDLWLNSFGSNSDESASTGDFNGDGITDAATFDRDSIGINRWRTRLSTNKPADLLTNVDNGIGGKTQIAYTYASKSDNQGLPFPVYVAESISLINTKPAGREATYTQTFSYSGGYYDAAEREFRGFAKVTVTDPITKNYTETYFYQGKPGQDGALKAQIEKIIAYDGNRRKISQAVNTYEVKTAGPQGPNFLGFPSLKEQVTTVWEENNTSLATKSRYTYDNIGNVTEEISEGSVSVAGDEKSSTTTYSRAYEYDAVAQSGFNRPLEAALKDKDANVISKKAFEYDNKGNLTTETVFIFEPTDSTGKTSETQYSYDSFGNLTSTTNALGGVVTTEYETDFYAYPKTVTNSLGHTVSYVYEPKFGVVKSVTDTNGATSSTTYDTFGRPVTLKNAYNQVTATFTYPDFNTKTTTNALGLFKTEHIDGLGRKYRSVSSGEDGTQARNVVSEVFFNSRGLTEKESLAHYENEDLAQISCLKYEYDLRGRVKKTISDFPGTEKDAESLINYISPLYSETTDPQGHKKGALKDVYGNIIEVTEFTQGGVYHTYYTYDLQNNLTQTKDSKDNTTQIFYDSLGRKLKMSDPDMGVWTYEYDSLGNLIRQTDSKDQAIEFSYDSLNRLIEKKGFITQGAEPVTLATYYYDGAEGLSPTGTVPKENIVGRLSKVTDPSGSTEFFYDKLGREVKSIKTIDSASYTVERSYDILDRLTTLKYPDGEVVTYTYDINSGLLESIRSTLSAIRYVKDITYNAKGQIKTIQYGNNTETTYTYGQDLRLSRIYTQGLSPQGTDPAVLQDLNYLFDHNGNLTTLTDNLRSNIRSYTYDNLDRLTEARNLPAPGGGYTNYTYQYDSIGNMTYKSDLGVMTYGLNAGPHALTSAGGYTYQYDANGNMAQGKNKTLSYDIENRLTQVTEGATITSFLYDGDGGRVMKGLTPQGTDPESWTLYIGSLFEIDSSGAVRKHIFAGANRVATKGLTPQGSVPELYYYHSDHLGSSSIITDKDGQLAQYCEYTPYGTLARNERTAQSAQPITHYFTGKELDSTGLYFYGARYYDPEIGRFITADTIVQAPYDPQSLNRYSYCRNNPINYIDPSGHLFWFVGLIIAAAIGAATGAVVAAATGGDIGKGALMGAITGAAFFGAGQVVGIMARAMQIKAGTLAMTALKTGVHAFTGAASGALGAVATGGDPGFAAITGGISAGASAFIGGVFPIAGNGLGAFAGRGIQRTLVGAILGGGTSLVMGGSFGEGAAMGARTSAVAYLANEAMHEGVKQAGAALTSKAEPKPTKDITNNETTNAKGPGPLLRFFGNIYKAGGEGGIGKMLSFVGNMLTPSGPLELSGRIIGGTTGFMLGGGIGALSAEPLGIFAGAVYGADHLGSKGAEWGKNADSYWGFSDGNLY